MTITISGAYLLGIRHIMPGESSRGGSFDSFCPFGALESFWALFTTGSTLKTTNLLNFAIFTGVLGVALVAGRAFCGWMCPLGGVQEFLAMFTRRLLGEKKHVRGIASKTRFPIHLPPRVDHWLRYFKYGVLLVIMLASMVAVYPPLRNLCPARAVFSFQLVTPLLWLVLLGFVASSLLIERFSCKYLCPLGAALAIFNKISPLRIDVDRNRCSSCGRCDVECPMDIIEVPENTRDSECIRCLECLETCSKSETIHLKLG